MLDRKWYKECEKIYFKQFSTIPYIILSKINFTSDVFYTTMFYLNKIFLIKSIIVKNQTNTKRT